MFRAATTRVSPRLSLATRSAAKRWATTTPKTPVDPTAPGPMLRYQKNLPKLPVPALSATLQKYLQSVRPLLSDAEFQRTEQAVKEFEAPGGLGQELQERLLAKANDPNVVNWMEDWWLDQAYMGYRDPVVIYVSYFFLYKDDKLRKSPAQRAAAIATAALEFKRQIAQKTLEPEYIESSDFVICLDDSKPVTRDEGSRACWHGDGRNRFFDKPLQFIVFENGKAGFMGEHSCMDGMATCRLNEFVCDGLARNKIEHGPTDIRSDLPEPQELHFDINSQVSKDIEAAETNFENLIKKHELTVLNYQAYGKDLIKKYKCSPDGFAQMIIQLAYYKMFGTSRPTYESAQTRKYQRGRTETARTVTVDSVAFVKAMEDPNVPVQEKISAFRKALKTQGANMADAVNGHGCDRHLFGLKNSLKDSEEKPELFKDPAYAYSSHWYLSTSQLSSEHFDGYGWGQVVNDGFGVAYMVKKHALQFNVASVKDLEVHGTKYVNGTYHFKQCLEDAANELKELMDTEIASEAKL
ncbi:Putative Carnitine O-acetyltransferase [Rhizopus microsporus]|nr:Putative Carnitine O-acetyltransferase [Rhizopus microsporus]